MTAPGADSKYLHLSLVCKLLPGWHKCAEADKKMLFWMQQDQLTGKLKYEDFHCWMWLFNKEDCKNSHIEQ